MARRRRGGRGRSRFSSFEGLSVSEGVRQSIIAVVIAAVGVFAFLAYLGVAGTVGSAVDDLIALLFGWNRWIVALYIFIIGGILAFPQRFQFSWLNVLGAICFFLGFNGLMNIVFLDMPFTPDTLSGTGGYIGLPISATLSTLIGVAGAVLTSIALLLVSIVLLFNTSLSTLVSAPVAVLRRRSSEEEDDEEEDEMIYGDDEVEEEVEEEEDEEIETDEDEELAPSKKAVKGYEPPPEESVMTTRSRRTMSIPVDLLDDKSSEAKSGDIERNTEIIRKTFENFNIEVEMTDVKVGPAVTQYALRPAQGVKLSRVVALQNDLALALAAHPIRVEAPIPGKSQVGIEVPNHTVGKVCLRELIVSKEFKESKSEVTAPLGKDVGGAVVTFAVDKAPHTLVAGATGSGKSVCLNTIIVSLLYQNGPDDLKFIMVDPKRVELGRYEGIPHLLVPPITKVEEAINALKWGVREMERRLDHLAKARARDIDAYNEKSKERMPKIVIVIDELADLMSQNKRDVEAVVVRIAQMARAAGIHLILATQRPSVDVITGTIKANIPTRMAFAVASQVDSKTILDISGAEKLLGRGDMLLSSPSFSKPKRLQGAYVSDAEIDRIVDFLKKEGTPDYNYQITEDTRTGGTAFSSEDSDPMLEDAIAVAIEAERVSTSYLQRRLKLGYSRAARIIDLMEQMGVVGPASGSKPREVLVSEWPPESEREEESDEDSEEEEASDESEGEEFDEVLEELDDVPDEDFDEDDEESERG